MNQQPDKFFRDKLDHYRPAVSPAAWQRVSQNLNKKNRRGLFLKVAAGVLLLATGTLLIYPSVRDGHTELVYENTHNSLPPHPALKDDPRESVPDRAADKVPAEKLETPPASNSEPGMEKKQSIRKVERRKETLSPLDNTEEVSPALSLKKEADPVRTETNDKENVPAEAQTAVAKEAAAGSNKMTIVFTADEVNRKYLTKNTEGEATTQEEQTSGVRKLLDKVNDFKHNQDLLGSIRQKKNEILAMNFKGEKETTRND